MTILNARGKSAGESAAGITASGPAPTAISDVQAEATEQGVLIHWRADAAAYTGTVELERVRLGTRPDDKKRDARLGQAPEEPPLLHLQGTSDAERAGALLDRTARFGEPYLYTVQRVKGVSVQGHTVELRSAPSAQMAITLRDVFAPLRPVGLVAVSGSGFVDLSWEANTEPDLAGYFVYREEGAQPGNVLSLNRDPVAIPAFRDTSVTVGHTYRYSVVAVDLTGNRSAVSDSVAETVRVP